MLALAKKRGGGKPSVATNPEVRWLGTQRAPVSSSALRVAGVRASLNRVYVCWSFPTVVLPNTFDLARHACSHCPVRQECRELWRQRKEALWSLMGLYPELECMTTDVCVPVSRLSDLIGQSKRELDASPLPAPIVAHAVRLLLVVVVGGDGVFDLFFLTRLQNMDAPAITDQGEKNTPTNDTLNATEMTKRLFGC